ncbi:DNA-directed RNA polymerase subunit delta [Virgibacillus doumboii]|uniref:DNA-directed RNA polymerase subunit delta n=1 Tax=Virgibacillus doumboii TaxID=2697503 RepID=UPI0013DFA678|nr:DNA-directed RNA polymerase subunit delta [Virgibacillus doumboii]
MSLKNYSREELEKIAMIELAHMILTDEKKAVNFHEIFNKVADLKGLTEEQKQETIGQFYTDLTIDGRFITVDAGMWGLKRWYPVEDMDLEATVPKKKKKKAKKKKEVKKKEPEEEEKQDVPDDDIEVLTGNFADEEIDESDDDFDEDFDDEEDGFDDEDEEDYDHEDEDDDEDQEK